MVLFSCSGEGEEEYGFVPKDKLPSQEFTDTTVLYSLGDMKKKMELRTTHLVKYKEKGNIMLSPVIINYFDKSGKLASWLKGDSGSANSKMDTLSAWGSVLIKSSGEKSLETEWIQWRKNEDIIYSDRDVKFTTEAGDVLTGNGFTSNSDLSEWKIHENVQAPIKDAGEIIE